MIVMIGTSIHTMGGIATVVKDYINAGIFKENDIVYISTHSDGSSLKKVIFAVFAYIRFLIMLLYKRFDIVHIHSASRASFYRKAIFLLSAKLFRKKIIFHLHGAEFRQFYEDESPFLAKALIQRILNSCDVIIVLSSKWHEWMQNVVQCGVNVKIIHNTVLLSNHVNPKKLPKQPVVVFLGRIGKRKGIMDLLQAIEMIKGSLDFKVKIAGDGEIKKYKDYIKEKKLDDIVEFLGWIDVEEKNKLLEAGAVLVLPSYNEGLPMSVLEALSYGLPVVATPVGGIPDVIRDGVNGFLIEPGDSKALARKIKILLTNSELYEALSTEAINEIRYSFNLLNTKKKLSDIYSSLR